MSLGTPRIGQVIRYAYLWHDEYLSGQEEGSKDRPAVVVSAVLAQEGGGYRVAVTPITHTPPTDVSVALEIPPALKQHLRLDAERSWVILNEVNVFEWPGYDIRPTADGRYEYGQLPPAFYERMIVQFRALVAAHRTKSSPRDGG